MRARIAVTFAIIAVFVASALSVAHAAPLNDDWINSKTIDSLPFTDALSTVGATTEATEPDANSSCAAAGASVWYRYTPATNDRLDMSTALSAFGAYIGIYTGEALDSLTLVACDRAPLIPVAGGVTYYLQVGDTDVDQTGNFVPVAGDLVLSIESLGTCPDCPVFDNYPVPSSFGFAHDAGETSIGNNPKTNATMFLMNTNTLRVTWDDAVFPPKPTWKVVNGFATSKTTADPILWTDRVTGRTFVAQLLGASAVGYTDDDGATWTTTSPAQVFPAFDHQSVGGGPYPAPLAGLNPIHQHAIYYCAQLFIEECSRSDDGGLTWNPQTVSGAPAVMCGGTHGHIQVAPNGTVVVPNHSCPGGQGIMASTNAGVTFEPRVVPGTRSSNGDPGAAYDSAGRLYFVTASNGIPVAATSTDDGKTWSKLVDLGRSFGIRNTEFTTAIAGSEGRAAVAFYGSTSGGFDQGSGFDGAWHLYIAATYDGGKRWETVDATPNDPVQRGCIWMGGFMGSNCRNLLDFQGMTLDAHGRIVVGYADGCTSDVCRSVGGAPGDSRDSYGVIARQTSGKGLLAAFDGTL